MLRIAKIHAPSWKMFVCNKPFIIVIYYLLFWGCLFVPRSKEPILIFFQRQTSIEYCSFYIRLGCRVKVSVLKHPYSLFSWNNDLCYKHFWCSNLLFWYNKLVFLPLAITLPLIFSLLATIMFNLFVKKEYMLRMTSYLHGTWAYAIKLSITAYYY